jgi:hypothetical protein
VTLTVGLSGEPEGAVVGLAPGFELAVEAGGVVGAGAGAGVLVGLAGAAAEQLTSSQVTSQLLA